VRHSQKHQNVTFGPMMFLLVSRTIYPLLGPSARANTPRKHGSPGRGALIVLLRLDVLSYLVEGVAVCWRSRFIRSTLGNVTDDLKHRVLTLLQPNLHTLQSWP